MNKHLKTLLLAISIFGAISCSSDPKKESFKSPDRACYPETWFHFIGGHIALDAVTADLEAIAQAGITGVHFFHGKSRRTWPDGDKKLVMLSQEWEDAVHYIGKECERLGLRLTVQNCPGWAMAGGPWIEPENAMRGLVMSRHIVDGEDIDLMLTIPQPSSEAWRDYRDIAVVAFPTPEGDIEPIRTTKVRGTQGVAWDRVFSDEEGVAYLEPSNEPYIAEVDFDGPTTVRTIVLPSVQSINHDMCYEPGVTVKAFVRTSDGNEHKIADLPLPASNWQDKSSFSIACPEVECAISCRMEIMITAKRAKLDKIRLYSAAMKNSWESEAGRTLRAFERSADDVIQSQSCYIASSEILDISDSMQNDGHLVWCAPKSQRWTILRIGHINEGKKNAPAPPEATGWECDKLSTDGADAHFQGYVGRLLNGPLKGGLLNGLLLDSWECSTQMWTKDMESEFSGRCGYEVRRWLPALFGYVIDEPEQTSKFLLDWRGTIDNLIVNKFFKRMAKHGHDNNLTVIYETAGGDVVPIDIMEYFKYADIPMCEFWQPFGKGYVGSLNFKPIKPTASASRLYGKPRVAAESFTSVPVTWNETPSLLKEYADYHFIEGVTYNILQTYTHNPQDDSLRPGTSFGFKIGTPFLRGQTWWPHMREFTTYLARCCYMLEAGRPVADVLWYLGDEIGHKPDQEGPFPQGFRFDYCNPDILLNRLSVKGDKIVTPEGLEYSLMWIPENKRMRPETLERIYELVKEGATLVAIPPKSISTLIGGAEAVERFNKAVHNIWGNGLEGDVINIGKGRVMYGTDLDKALQEFGLTPDVKGDVRWIHRQSRSKDWYFITPLKSSSFKGSVAIKGKGAVELWDPISGEVRPIKAHYNDGYTTFELDMPHSGSCFIVIDKSRRHLNPQDASYNAMMILDDNWQVSFPEGWGAPKQIELDELKAWCEMDMTAEGKAFAGTASYRTTFTIDAGKVGKSAILELGEVSSIAKVKVNGVSVRTLWCSPYRVDIGAHLKDGENLLEIDVTSSWHNRLVYDASLPEEQRKTWVICGPNADNELLDYGLLGPIRIKYQHNTTLR